MSYQENTATLDNTQVFQILSNLITTLYDLPSSTLDKAKGLS